MVSECDVHEEGCGDCRRCKGGGTNCDHAPNYACDCPPCPACKGDGTCQQCEAWQDAQARYWGWYFGAEIQRAAQQARDEREDYGRELTGNERMSEARRLK